MAKNGEMTWFTSGTTLDLSTGTPVSSFSLISNPEGVVAQGKLRLTRLFASCNVLLGDITAGAHDIHVWFGVVKLDDQDAQTPRVIQKTSGTADADDNMVWLWRQPLPVFGTGLLYTAAGNDLVSSHMLDIPMRGGAGTNLKTGQDLRLVGQCVNSVGEFPSAVLVDCKLAFTMLELYWGGV